jgi:hypothetical protein
MVVKPSLVNTDALTRILTHEHHISRRTKHNHFFWNFDYKMGACTPHSSQHSSLKPLRGFLPYKDVFSDTLVLPYVHFTSKCALLPVHINCCWFEKCREQVGGPRPRFLV